MCFYAELLDNYNSMLITHKIGEKNTMVNLRLLIILVSKTDAVLVGELNCLRKKKRRP